MPPKLPPPPKPPAALSKACSKAGEASKEKEAAHRSAEAAAVEEAEEAEVAEAAEAATFAAAADAPLAQPPAARMAGFGRDGGLRGGIGLEVSSCLKALAAPRGAPAPATPPPRSLPMGMGLAEACSSDARGASYLLRICLTLSSICWALGRSDGSGVSMARIRSCRLSE